MARRGRPKPRRPAPSDLYELDIRALGSRGDGITALPDGRTAFIEGALPGERVLAEVVFRDRQPPRGSVREVIRPAGFRRTPPCAIAPVCGGCMVQHLEPDSYVEWKASLVTSALAEAGLDPAVVEPLRLTGERTRRRAVWQYRYGENRLMLGYAVRRGDRIADAVDCLLLDPALQQLMDRLRDALPVLFDGPAVRRGRLLATLTDAGPDLLIELDREAGLNELQGLTQLAEDLDLARLGWRNGPRGEAVPAAVRRQPVISFGALAPAFPAGAFLQASVPGEHEIRDAVLDCLDGVDGPVADLFAGLGSLTVPVLDRHNVHAVEGMEAQTGALGAAARLGGMQGRLTVETRDLDRRPLIPAELDRFAAIILDPPRAGARRQVQEIASCRGPSRLVYVSCSADSFARDAALLAQSGWGLVTVRPIDQFVYSDQVELVARFDRKP
jgi:23S rRNA (uracil1939-C5)-methyltransferase